jgi:ADP-heptose:LPS heptosyltransferase
VENIIRKIALFLRQRSEQKNEFALLRQYEEWRLLLQQLPQDIEREKKLAIVRLDDIGDYLLFRNFLLGYKQSDRFKDYAVTLIGNIVWKPIFEAFDSETVDTTIWLDKHQYLSNAGYRMDFWQQICAEHFDTIICPSRTRPLLLDDLIVLASGAKTKIACCNSYETVLWNEVSDRNYDQLFSANGIQHEFFFNQNFSSFVLGRDMQLEAPFLPSTTSEIDPKQIICFIGASAKSKTWPLNNWIELVQLLQEKGFEPLLSGGKNEGHIAEKIVSATQVKSIVGQTNLVETIKAIASSIAVITGDTMAAHAAVSLNKPSVILANGVNAQRFVAYEEAGFDKVKTVYTQQYLRSKKDKHYRAVTKDMETIRPMQIFNALKEILHI